MWEIVNSVRAQISFWDVAPWAYNVFHLMKRDAAFLCNIFYMCGLYVPFKVILNQDHYTLQYLLCVITIMHYYCLLCIIMYLVFMYLLSYFHLDFLFQSNPLWFISMAYRDGTISMEPRQRIKKGGKKEVYFFLLWCIFTDCKKGHL